MVKQIKDQAVTVNSTKLLRTILLIDLIEEGGTVNVVLQTRPGGRASVAYQVLNLIDQTGCTRYLAALVQSKTKTQHLPMVQCTWREGNV